MKNENVNLKNCRDGPVGPEAAMWRHETAQSAIGAREVARAWGTGDVRGVTSGHSAQIVEPGWWTGPPSLHPVSCSLVNVGQCDLDLAGVSVELKIFFFGYCTDKDIECWSETQHCEDAFGALIPHDQTLKDGPAGK